MLQQALCLSSLALPYFCFTTFCMRDPKSFAISWSTAFGVPSFRNNFNHFLAATCHFQVTCTLHTNCVGHGDVSAVPLMYVKLRIDYVKVFEK